MTKFFNGITNFYRVLLLIFGVAEVALLWAMSIFFICYISSDTNEVTFFCKNNSLLNILVVICFIAILFLLRKKSVIEDFAGKLEDDAFFNRIKNNSLRIITVIGFLWVIITQYVPGSDQLDVLSSAYKYGNGTIDMVQAGGYLDKWPHNIGITTVERVLAFFVGDFNITFMQLLNVIGIVLIYKKMVDTWDRLGGSRISQICTLVCGILFYPLIMYASFVYGNIWHVTLALVAFDFELDFLEKKNYLSILKCAVALGLSFLIKASAIIFLVAFIIFAIVKGISEKADVFKTLVLIVALITTVSVFSSVPKWILTKTTGEEIREDGIWSFIAMALQEDGTAPGWYNGYCLNVYYDNNRDSELAEKQAKEEVYNRLNYFLSDKRYAYEFFSKKIASMWNEPTYESYWINQVRTHRVIFPKWLDSFMSAKGYTTAAKVFSAFQVLILTGTVLWLIFEDKKEFVNKSFLLLCFVGGFTFNLMWETKSQYAITYFIMLFPYAITGYEILLNKGKEIFVSLNKIILAYTLAFVVFFLGAYELDGSHCLSQHNEEYAKYVAEWNVESLNESVNEINVMKAWLKGYEEQCIYYQKVLNDNGIAY